MAVYTITATVAGQATGALSAFRRRGLSLTVAGLSAITIPISQVRIPINATGTATVSVTGKFLNNLHHLSVVAAGQATPTPGLHAKRRITASAVGVATASAVGVGIPYAILDSTAYMVSTRVLIANGDGTLLDYSSQAGYNWIDGIEIDANIDQPVSQLTLSLRRDIIDSTGTVYSLSPLRSDSVLNVNAASAFAPAIDVDRAIQVLVATTAPGVQPVTADWQNLFTGVIDTVDSGHTSMQITARDLGGALVDAFILPGVIGDATATSGPTYGSTAGVPMETVMQQILDDWMGVGVVTLYCPVSPNYLISPPYTQQLQSVSDALVALAGLIGWDIRYVWDPNTLAWRLTLQTINRTQTTPDRTLKPNRYLEVTQLQIANTDVRNIVTVWYQDSVSGTLGTITVQNAESIAQYGARTMVVDESTGVSPINTLDQATTFANNMLADLSTPLADQIIVEHFDWTVFLNALQLYKANGIHYNTDQQWAVISYKHNITATQARTTVEVRGAPCGRYLNWLSLASLPSTAAPDPTLENFRVISEDPYSVTYGWTLGPDAAEVWANSIVFTSPIPTDPWTTVASGVAPLGALTYTIQKPPAGSFTYAQIEPRTSGLVAGEIQRVVLTPGQSPIDYGASPQGTGSVDSNGNFSASVDGTQQCVSYRWLISTTTFPADGAVEASGTIVNGRQFDLVDVLTLAFGQTAYLTAVPYSAANATGVFGPSVRVRGSYLTYTTTKTVSYPAAGFTLLQGQGLYPNGGYFGPNVTTITSIAAGYIMQLPILLPVGTTVLNVSQDVYYNDPGGANIEVGSVGLAVLRYDSSSPWVDGLLNIGTAAATNLLGAQTLSIVLSDPVTVNAYLLWASFNVTNHGMSYVHPIITAYAGACYVTYQMANPTTTL